MPSQPDPDAGKLLLGALLVADDTVRRTVGHILDQFYDYDHARRAYVPRGVVTEEEMRRVIEEALS